VSEKAMYFQALSKNKKVEVKISLKLHPMQVRLHALIKISLEVLKAAI